MRIITLHVDWIEWEAVKPALRNPEPAEEGRQRMENALVVLTAIERGDTEEEIKEAAESVKDVCQRVGVSRVVVYPWVHLTSQPEKPGRALELTKRFAEEIERLGLEVRRAPFGWYKAFALSVKGHPLAELSREFRHA